MTVTHSYKFNQKKTLKNSGGRFQPARVSCSQGAGHQAGADGGRHDEQLPRDARHLAGHCPHRGHLTAHQHQPGGQHATSLHHCRAL